jgi:hypothetical protein
MTDFYFGRELEQEEAWRLLNEGKNLLLQGSRRIGKTMLAQLLLARAKAADWETSMIDIGGCKSEIEVVDMLERATQNVAERIFAWMQRSKLTIGEEFALNTDSLTWQQRGLHRFKLLAGRGRTVLFIDEMSVFLARLLRNDPERGEIWLHTLRSWEQQCNNVQIILAGSISISTLANRYELGTAINNYHIFPVDVFEHDVADQYLQEIARRKRRPLSDTARARLLHALAWHSPFYYDGLFEAAWRQKPKSALALETAEDVDRGVEAFLSHSASLLKHWHDRLKDHGESHAQAMRLILKRIAAIDNGLLRQEIGGRDSELSYYLNVLCDEGYLEQIFERSPSVARYRFVSPLIRTWWQRQV